MRHSQSLFIIIAGTMLSACSQGGSSDHLPPVAGPQPLGAVTMQLLNGQTVTIAQAAEPPIELPSQVPAAALFQASVQRGRTSSALRKRMSSTQPGADHSTYGWYMPSFGDSVPYNGQGYVMFHADMGLPVLHLAPAGSSGSYVYFAPTTQGSDGNPLEVGLETLPAATGSSTQRLFIYDWASPSGGPCEQPGYSNCVGFATYSPVIDAAFVSKYVRVLSHGLPEWSMVTFQATDGKWYFGIYNFNTNSWEYPYAEQHSEVSHNYTLNADGPSGGHGFFEYYLPAGTSCAGAEPAEPAAATAVETDAEQYSTKTGSWTRISDDAYAVSGLSGSGTCFSQHNNPYFSVGSFGDGWSNWKATTQSVLAAP